MKRGKAVIICLLVVAIAALGMIIYKMKFSNNSMANSYPDANGMNFDGMATMEFVSAYGVTNIGTETEAFPIEELTVGLKV